MLRAPSAGLALAVWASPKSAHDFAAGVLANVYVTAQHFVGRLLSASSTASRCSSIAKDRPMEYKRFIIKSFEREPGKWRATVKRSDGKPTTVSGRVKLCQFVTGVDATTAEAALQAAIAAIDAGAFSRRAASETTSSTKQ